MEAYDFLNEKLKPIIKGDYQDFSSKKVEGYSLFVSEYKKSHVQAMVRVRIVWRRRIQQRIAKKEG